jgi:hypothetical protein
MKASAISSLINYRFVEVDDIISYHDLALADKKSCTSDRQ